MPSVDFRVTADNKTKWKISFLQKALELKMHCTVVAGLMNAYTGSATYVYTEHFCDLDHY